MAPDILCIGSVLWDIIGHARAALPRGADMPGRITRAPGGVALNVAAALARLGLRPGLLTAIGRDAEGEALIAACVRLGLVTAHVHRPGHLPTDRYMAIEDADGLVAALADAGTLEAAGDAILAPLGDGTLGSAARPWGGTLVLDGNLASGLLAEIAVSPLFRDADLRVVPASPVKALRLRPLMAHPRATFHLNRAEAEVLAGRPFADAPSAAAGLLSGGARRAVVTDGADACADGNAGAGIVTGRPPAVAVSRITGAGDAFMAAHLVAERGGAGRSDALAAALRAAAAHVSAPAADTPGGGMA